MKIWNYKVMSDRMRYYWYLKKFTDMLKILIQIRSKNNINPLQQRNFQFIDTTLFYDCNLSDPNKSGQQHIFCNFYDSMTNRVIRRHKYLVRAMNKHAKLLRYKHTKRYFTFITKFTFFLHIKWI